MIGFVKRTLKEVLLGTARLKFAELETILIETEGGKVEQLTPDISV